jgi:K+-sensing histidine kinase KdpD
VPRRTLLTPQPGLARYAAAVAAPAALTLVLVDYLFVAPQHTLSISNSEDVVNLVAFFGAAGLVGTLGSRRRNAQLRAQALAAELQAANLTLARLNRDQAEAAQLAAQLASVLVERRRWWRRTVTRLDVNDLTTGDAGMLQQLPSSWRRDSAAGGSGDDAVA